MDAVPKDSVDQDTRLRNSIYLKPGRNAWLEEVHAKMQIWVK